jgi:hypothetical protein
MIAILYHIYKDVLNEIQPYSVVSTAVLPMALLEISKFEEVSSTMPFVEATVMAM